jgi:hypothetical protein
MGRGSLPPEEFIVSVTAKSMSILEEKMMLDLAINLAAIAIAIWMSL